MELVRDPAVGAIERARVGADGPVSRESPMVESQVRGRGIGVGPVPHRRASRVESGCLFTAEVALRRPEVLPIRLYLIGVRFNRSHPRP